MKDETKLKIKKAAKIGGLIAGFLATFILGMGFGSCSEKKVQDQSSQKAQSKSIAPKMELSPDDNLLNRATYLHSYYIFNIGPDSDISLGVSSDFETYLLNYRDVPEGHTYAMTFEGDFTATPFSYFYGVNGLANALKSRAENRETYSASQTNPVLFKNASVRNGLITSPLLFTLESGFYRVESGGGSSNIATLSICAPSGVTGLYLIGSDGFIENYDGGYSLEFPESNWYPYQIWGGNNSPVVRGPVHGNMNPRFVAMEDVVFISNKTLYSGIQFEWAPVARAGSDAAAQGSACVYGYFNTDMSLDWAQACQSDDLWYLSSVQYRQYGSNQYKPVGGQRLKIYSDYSMAVTQYFDWVSPVFSRMQVIKWTDSANGGITTASLSSIEWLKAIASSVFDSTISLGGNGADVFSLIGNGFQSVTAILNVQILPYLTLGTLLLAPLVIILALTILKVLNK